MTKAAYDKIAEGLEEVLTAVRSLPDEQGTDPVMAAPDQVDADPKLRAEREEAWRQDTAFIRTAKIELGARALAFAELNEYGRKTCDWKCDFSDAEKRNYRIQAAIVIDAINVGTTS